MKYRCEDCEDVENFGDCKKDSVLCECGAWMHALRPDNFKQHTNLCLKCQNFASVACEDCKWFPTGEE